MKQEKADELQAALGAYKGSMRRLEGAGAPEEIKDAAKRYLKANQRFKAAVKAADKDEALVDLLVDIAFDPDDRFIDLRRTGFTVRSAALEVGKRFLAENFGDFPDGVELRYLDPAGDEQSCKAELIDPDAAERKTD